MSLRQAFPAIALLLAARLAAAEGPVSSDEAPPEEEIPWCVPPEDAPPPLLSPPEARPLLPPLTALRGTRPRRHRFLAELEAGVAYQQIFSSHALAGAAELRLGAELERIDIGGRIGLRGGQTLAGLPVFLLSLGPELDFRAGRWLRFGAGVDFGPMYVGRVTGGSFVTPYFGFHPDLWIDIDRFGRGRSLYLHLRVLGELFRADMLPSLAAQASLGCRF